MLIKLREEKGIALVMAMLVTMVMLILSTVVIAQALHSLNGSGLDRRRLESVNTAEAGLNYWFSYLQTTSATSFACGTKTATLASGPNSSSYSATATFYQSDGSTVFDCSSTPVSNSSYPSYAFIKSIGTQGTATRTMESFVRLTPTYGGFGAAIISNSATSFGNNFDIYGNSGSNGNVYILNGSLTISNTPNIRGNVYIPSGGATISNNNKIWGDLYARDAISLANGSTVGGNAYDETAGISGAGTITGNATAHTTITGVTVGGTKLQNQTMSATPTISFPTFTYNSGLWSGYTIKNETSAATAKTDVTTWASSGSGNLLVRLTPASCTSPSVASNTFAPGNTNITLPGNLAVISDCGFDLSKTSWLTASSTTAYTVTLASLASSTTCASINPAITMDQLTDWASNISALLYAGTGCTANIGNKTQFTGQVLAGSVSITNHFTMTYAPVSVPGLNSVTGFSQDLQYIREVA